MNDIVYILKYLRISHKVYLENEEDYACISTRYSEHKYYFVDGPFWLGTRSYMRYLVDIIEKLNA